MAMSVNDQLRHAIEKAEKAGRTRYAMSVEAGVPQSTLSRFAHQHRGLSLDMAERIAGVLGLRVVLAAKGKTARKGK